MTHPATYLASLADHPLWQNPFLHLISAGWATADDFSWFSPLLEHAARVRNQSYLQMSSRACKDSAALMQLAQEAGDYTDELTRWAVVDDNASLPTFALYLELQFQIQCQGDLGNGFAHLLLLEYATSQIRYALQRAWHKKHPDSAEPALDSRVHQHLLDAISKNNTQLPDQQLETHLALLSRWFEDLYQGLRQHRTASLTNKIQAKRSLQASPGSAMSLASGIGMRAERDDKRQQEFSVARLPCDAETLDPRIVRIAPGKFNNLHRHAHETLFCLLQGEGEILIGTDWVPFKAGEAVFAPRWAMHQTHNTGTEELVMYAITDYYLSNLVFIGANSTTVA